jgi:hypothetical protein
MAALVAAVLAWTIHHYSSRHSPVVVAAVVLVPYGLIYLAAAHALGVDEAGAVFARALGIVRRK